MSFDRDGVVVGACIPRIGRHLSPRNLEGSSVVRGIKLGTARQLVFLRP